MQNIDLRSDTITLPTPAMRKAMADADVGDDVFGEDPSVNRLEELAADKLGKEAAMFVPSGTMGNLICQMTHCKRGDESILGDQSHVFYYEQGGSAAVGGIHPRTLTNQPDGTILVSDIEYAIRPMDQHFPISRLIILENTHNRCNGNPLPLPYLKQVKKLAQKYDLKIHMDGARIFNAAVALGLDVAEIAGWADSVSFCLSKALAAPVGSVICGSKKFIDQARRNRKVLGGGMRQAGVLAAAGIIALEQMVDRLAEDHINAKTLAHGLSDIKGIAIDPSMIHTNIVYFNTRLENVAAQTIVEALDDNGVKMLAAGPQQIRAVTNYHILPEDISFALGVVKRVMQQLV